ncbi:hypothetical protein FAZ69_26495 [Trinickia terrae]|uniref:Calcineurin-like phosphoesterase domain-containing protein n=1 Tax=Trinickia terrae TaxID=2571161 RepID=A0A4U1HQP8_9BURK|nr:hypothetical protein [Trinickia terrae]TKC82633.1 hypothetical protein FAZ69_26495 [Trinickia terrae]
MRNAERRMRPQATRLRQPIAHGAAALAVALVCCLAPASRANAAAPRYSFSVIGNTLEDPADEAPTQRLLEAIGLEKQMSFVVYDGNLKSASEACRDTLYEQRQQVLESSRAPLFFIPGGHDWVACGQPQAGGYDAVERLDFLRQTMLADTTSMGQNPLALTRESEVARFRPYRENIRWQIGDTVFIGLNVPGENNHYLSAGGRNGEFEDRVVATAFWLEHAAEYAKRRDARAVVVFIQGAPDLKQYERPDRFAWLRFERARARDGYLEFKRSLVKLAETFHGPVLLVHCDDRRLTGGFLIDQPLYNDKGARAMNLTRIAIAPHDRLKQWVQIDADFARQPPFRVSLRNVPRNLPVPAAPQTEAPSEEPAVPPVPDASGLMPALPASDLQPLPPQNNQGVPPMLPPPSNPASQAPAPDGAAPASSSMQRGP